MSDMNMPMAWNEPGGDKQDPWGKKPSADGPPDLDEAFKKFFKKLGFNLGGKGGGQNSPGKASYFGIGAIAILLAVLYFIAGFYTVAPYEQGIVTRFGRYDRMVGQGLHWSPKLIEKVEKVSTVVKTSMRSGWMLTEDENILQVDIEVHYRVLDGERYLFNVVTPENTLLQVADSALRQVVGDSLTDDVLTDKKQQIADKIKDTIVSILEVYDSGLTVELVNFRNSKPPEEVKDSFDDVTKSREDRNTLTLQAEAYANKIIPEAEGQAQRMLEDADGYKAEVILRAAGETQKFSLIYPEYQKAPKVTKTRMYVDALEQVLENSNKVLVDVNSGNSLIYLPLDQLMHNRNYSQKTEEFGNIIPKKLEELASDAQQALTHDSRNERYARYKRRNS